MTGFGEGNVSVLALMWERGKEGASVALNVLTCEEGRGPVPERNGLSAYGFHEKAAWHAFPPKG